MVDLLPVDGPSVESVEIAQTVEIAVTVVTVVTVATVSVAPDALHLEVSSLPGTDL